MANIKSQIKRNRQNERRRERNKAVRSKLRTEAKQVREARDSGSFGERLAAASREIDKAAAAGVLHKKTAARRKSRLARAGYSAATDATS